MTARPALKHFSPGQGKAVPIGSVRLSFKAGSVVGSNYAVAEMTFPPGSENPLHAHPTEETMYVLEGEFEFLGDNGDRRIAGPGSVMHVPANAAHGFNNVGTGVGRLLLVLPATMEAFLDDLSEAMASEKVDPEAVATVRARYGVVSVGLAARGQ